MEIALIDKAKEIGNALNNPQALGHKFKVIC